MYQSITYIICIRFFILFTLNNNVKNMIMKKNIFLGMLFSIFMYLSCSDNESIQPVSFNQNPLSFKAAGGHQKIMLTNKGRWRVDSIPEWIHLDQTSGVNTTEIGIAVYPNNDTEKREAEIIFFNENLTTKLLITQDPAEIEMRFYSLGFLSIDDYRFVLGKNNVERKYNIEIFNLYVNPADNPQFKDMIFVGNLVGRKLDSNRKITEYKGYTFIPITVSASPFMVSFASFIPSRKNQEEYVDRIRSAMSDQSDSFYSNGGSLYGSHRQLNLIGRGNLGVNLDEIISGKSYRDQEMVKRNGLIFFFSHSAFSLTMDLQLSVVKEDLKQSDFTDNELCRICQVMYGRYGVLLVESDYSHYKVKGIVNKVLREESQFTKEELIVLNEMVACHFYFDKEGKQHVTKGRLDAIKSYKDQLFKGEMDFYPYQFAVIDNFNLGPTSMGYDFTLH